MLKFEIIEYILIKLTIKLIIDIIKLIINIIKLI